MATPQGSAAGRAADVRVDVWLMLVATLAIWVTIGAAREEGARDLDVWAYVLGAAVAAPLLVRRRRPVAGLLASALLLYVYFAIGYPGITVAVALALGTYSAAVAGHTRAAIAIAGGFELLGFTYRTVIEGESLVSALGIGTLTDVALLACVILLAELVRSRRALQAETRERMRVLERERDLEAERRVEHERVRIARDLHDILAHTIAVINVHAGVAGDVLASDPAQARVSLQAIREQTRAAMGELRATLGVLRDEGAELQRAPAPMLAQLPELTERARRAELAVELSVSGARRPLAAPVELTAYRVVQEALTNVLRHANAGAAQVRLAYERDALVVEVVDDGDGPRAAGNGSTVGHGIAGMHERVRALGGTLQTGAATTPGGGYRVTARLPTEGGG